MSSTVAGFFDFGVYIGCRCIIFCHRNTHNEAWVDCRTHNMACRHLYRNRHHNCEAEKKENKISISYLTLVQNLCRIAATWALAACPPGFSAPSAIPLISPEPHSPEESFNSVKRAAAAVVESVKQLPLKCLIILIGGISKENSR